MVCAHGPITCHSLFSRLYDEIVSRLILNSLAKVWAEYAPLDRRTPISVQPGIKLSKKAEQWSNTVPLRPKYLLNTSGP